MTDGTKYSAKPGDTVEVSEHHAKTIKNSYYGTSGIMRGGSQFSVGTKIGRWCDPCARLWNAWNTDCPRCGATTEKQEGRAA